MTAFKVQKYPNSKKGQEFDPRVHLTEKTVRDYIVSEKLNGVNIWIDSDGIKTRAGKLVPNVQVQERFRPIHIYCMKLGIGLGFEFWDEGYSLGELNRLIRTSDFTSSKVLKRIANSYKKGEYAAHRSLEWCQTAHPVKLAPIEMFDPKSNMPYEARVLLFTKIAQQFPELVHQCFRFWMPETISEIEEEYSQVTSRGGEGLMIIHRNMPYKQGRHTFKSAQAFKYKEDSIEYTGMVVGFVQATRVKDDVEKTTDLLGYSKTSKRKADREPIPAVGSFLTEYYEDGQLIGTFAVKPQGWTQDELSIMWHNRDDILGRKFTYTGMRPEKKFPLLAHFKAWL